MITEFGALSTDRIRNTISPFGPKRCQIHWVLYTPKYCIRDADVAVHLYFYKPFLRAIQSLFQICNLHDYSPSFSRWVPQNPGWVDIVRRSNKDFFHRETESTLKLSLLDKVMPKYCSWFLAVIRRLFSPGRHPFFFARYRKRYHYG